MKRELNFVCRLVDVVNQMDELFKEALSTKKEAILHQGAKLSYKLAAVSVCFSLMKGTNKKCILGWIFGVSISGRRYYLS